MTAADREATDTKRERTANVQVQSQNSPTICAPSLSVKGAPGGGVAAFAAGEESLLPSLSAKGAPGRGVRRTVLICGSAEKLPGSTLHHRLKKTLATGFGRSGDHGHESKPPCATVPN